MNSNPISPSFSAEDGAYTVALTDVKISLVSHEWHGLATSAEVDDEPGELVHYIRAHISETFDGARLSYDDQDVVSLCLRADGQCDVCGMPELDSDSDALVRSGTDGEGTDAVTVGDRNAITCLAFLQAVNSLQLHSLESLGLA
jgi:hypothetical protein